MPRFFSRIAPLVLGFAFLAGCRSEEEEKLSRRIVALETLPPHVMTTAKKTFPGVEFQDAWTNHVPGSDAIHSYEVRGRDKVGKVFEVSVFPNGKFRESD